MKQLIFSPCLWKKTGLLLLVSLLLLCGAAHAGSIYIDTSGLSGTVGETTQVPVKVSGANSLYTIELQCGLVNTADAVVAFNDTSMQKYGLIYSQNTGKVAQINLAITGDDTLFYLDVTPKKASAVDLTITLFATREGTVEHVSDVAYTSSGAVLNVGGVNPPVTPTATPTATPTPTVAPTVSPTNPPVTPTPTVAPTVIPTVIPSESDPTTAPTSPALPTDTVPTTVPTVPTEQPKSPAPLAGLLAGLAGALYLTRKHS